MFNINFKQINLSSRLKLFAYKKKMPDENIYRLFPDSPVDDENFPDIFGREKIAKEVSRAIRGSKGQINFLIAGEWGIGKTSILNKIDTDLKRYGISTILFSPWRYSKTAEGANAISRAFLSNLAEKFEKTHEVRELYVKRQIENERNIVSQLITLIPIIIRYFLYIIVVFLFLFLLKQVFPPFKQLLDKVAISFRFEDQVILHGLKPMASLLRQAPLDLAPAAAGIGCSA